MLDLSNLVAFDTFCSVLFNLASLMHTRLVSLFFLFLLYTFVFLCIPPNKVMFFLFRFLITAH